MRTQEMNFRDGDQVRIPTDFPEYELLGTNLLRIKKVEIDLMHERTEQMELTTL